MVEVEQVLGDVYDAFNRRDLDAVLARMDTDVDWPNAWEGGRVSGRDAVRTYWERQFKEISSRVEPVGFSEGEGAARSSSTSTRSSMTRTAASFSARAGFGIATRSRTA